MPIAKSQLLQYVLENSATCIQPGPSSMSYSVLLEVVSDFSYLFTFRCESSFLSYMNGALVVICKIYHETVCASSNLYQRSHIDKYLCS